MSIRPLCHLPLAALLALVGCVDRNPEDSSSVLGSADPTEGCAQFALPSSATANFTPAPDSETVSIFDESTIVPLDITFTPPDWQDYEAVWKNPKWAALGDNVDPAWEKEKASAWVHCSVRAFGGEPYDAACRPRGSPEDWYKESKPQIKLKFNKWNKKGRFQGLRGMSLEYNYRRPAPISDRIAMRMFRDLGLPAPRVNNVRVTLNGVDRGIYLNLEVIDKEFLEDHFADAEGNLYEGGVLKSTNESVLDACDMDLVWALFDGKPEKYPEVAAEIERLVDMNELLLEVAAEVVFPTPDNLSNDSTNYYLYHVPQGPFVALVNDMDSVLGYRAEDVNADVYWNVGSPTGHGTLLTSIAGIPSWRQRFEDNVVRIRDGVFAAIPAQVQAACDQLRPELTVDADWLNRHRISDLLQDCESMKQYVADRTLVLKASLGR